MIQTKTTPEQQGFVRRDYGLSSHKLPFKSPFFYGWVIVVMGALGLFFSGPGQTYSVSVFIDAYIEAFGWDRTLVSSIYSGATLLAGLLLFVVGKLVDRFGQRPMTVAVALLLGLACLWNSFVMGPVMLFIGFFLIRLLGQGSMTLLPNTLVPQWFVRYRGRAISFMSVGVLLSAAAFPPLNNWLIQNWGWPVAWRVWFVVLVFFFAPLALYLIRNKPEDVGLLPDNDRRRKSTGSVGTTMSTSSIQEESWTLKEAMRTRAFWLILFCVGVPSMVNTGITFHLFSILAESGIGRGTTAFLLSLVPLIGFVCSLAAGFIMEKVKVHYVLCVTFLIELGSIMILLLGSSVYTILFFVLLWGIFEGFLRVCVGVVWPNYFGREHLGTIRSVVTTVTVIGSALGPLPFGIAYDLYGRYSEVLLLIMLFPLLAVFAAILSPPPVKKA
ncbi:MFS family permease [Caldalkalibacillus uzonensis]|uniref:MFS family permease n=1 Tax=Caldalkalibacillus uzonensis TaxID=353224 RepID=A0ABU0CSE2_9BACI|nr:MFS transporter [Caldalkalibacillus uzonensis]MDQ0338779.1 MFS family permease [Caldalkalibacillus uzonensis]